MEINLFHMNQFFAEKIELSSLDWTFYVTWINLFANEAQIDQLRLNC